MSTKEVPADSKNHHLTFRKVLPLSPSADTHRSARHALSLIATARPSVFIATTAKETGSSLFGILGSSLKCVRSYTTVSPSPKMSPALLKLTRLVWINHKNVILLMADGTEYKYTV